MNPDAKCFGKEYKVGDPECVKCDGSKACYELMVDSAGDCFGTAYEEGNLVCNGCGQKQNCIKAHNHLDMVIHLMGPEDD